MHRTTVFETVSECNTDVVLPNGDVVHTPSEGTLTVRVAWTFRSTRERARCRQRWFLLRPQGRRPRRWRDTDTPVVAG